MFLIIVNLSEENIYWKQLVEPGPKSVLQAHKNTSWKMTNTDKYLFEH